MPESRGDEPPEGAGSDVLDLGPDPQRRLARTSSAGASGSEAAFEATASRISVRSGRSSLPPLEGNFLSSMSEMDSVDENHEAAAKMDVNTLLDNNVSRALMHRPSLSAGHEFERWIAKLMTEASDGADHAGGEKAQEPESNSGSFQVNKPTSARAVNRVMSPPNFLDLSNEEGLAYERKDLMMQLFREGQDLSLVQEKHLALFRVINYIFATYPDARQPAPLSTASSRLPCFWTRRRICELCAKVVEHYAFIMFYMLLTIYALFVPELVLAFATKHEDDAFQNANTAVFFLYVVELLFHLCGVKRYFLTVNVLLDLASIFSIFLETGMYNEDDGFQSSTTSRLARSQRLARLARLARIARFTRLIPRIQQAYMEQKSHLAKNLFLRRLWRVFLFLDTDKDKALAALDLKFAYIVVMEKCHKMLSSLRTELLRKDMPILLSADNALASISFNDFSEIFQSTRLGAELLQFHREDLKKDEGIWQLVRKVSDRTALKVCVGILALLGMLSLIDGGVVDRSAEQGLAQLDVIARGEHERGADVGAGGYFCEQIQLYAQRHAVMFLYLDRVSYTWSNGCSPSQAFSAGLAWFAHVESLIAGADMRASEVKQVSWPESSDDYGDQTTSFVLIDDSATQRRIALWAFLTTISVIFLLLCFLHIMNMKMDKFSQHLLSPLRALLDDMEVLSNLELAHIDEDMPVEKSEATRRRAAAREQTAEELEHLQSAFASMRGAIRSWSKFVPPSVVERLFSAGLEAQIGVERCLTTILFCDIDGFEAACHGLAPTEILHVLSTFAGLVADVIQKNNGTLLEFIGDEILAVWNTPKQLKSHVFSGVRTALEIHGAVDRLPEMLADGRKIRCRCGVHTTPILAGNIGSHHRMKYGLLGDGINLTARLKSLNSRYRTDTLVSAKVAHDPEARRNILFRPVDLVAVKGKTEPTVVYETFVVREELSGKAKHLAERHSEGFELYQLRRFPEARAAFDEVNAALKAHGDKDEVSRLMAIRCADYQKKPPPPEWDGVERLVKKSFAEASPPDETPTSEAETIPYCRPYLPRGKSVRVPM